MTMFLQMKNDEQRGIIRLQNIYALTRLAPDPKQESEGKEGFSTFTRRMNEKTAAKDALPPAICCHLPPADCLHLFLTRTLTLPSTSATEMNTLYVPAGQRAQLTLQDGTQVWLNAQSLSPTPPDSTENNARFRNWEAYFKVAETERNHSLSPHNSSPWRCWAPSSMYTVTPVGIHQDIACRRIIDGERDREKQQTGVAFTRPTGYIL